MLDSGLSLRSDDLSHLFNRYAVNLQRFVSSRSRLSLNICKLVLKSSMGETKEPPVGKKAPERTAPRTESGTTKDSANVPVKAASQTIDMVEENTQYGKGEPGSSSDPVPPSTKQGELISSSVDTVSTNPPVTTPQTTTPRTTTLATNKWQTASVVPRTTTKNVNAVPQFGNVKRLELNHFDSEIKAGKLWRIRHF